MKSALILAALLFVSLGASGTPKIIRASELGTNAFADITTGKFDDVIIEFRQGDELPVNLEAQGDLFETRKPSVTYLTIKKNFWLRIVKSDLEVSFDGSTYKKLNDALTGSLEAGAGPAGGGVADAINVSIKAFLK